MSNRKSKSGKSTKKAKADAAAETTSRPGPNDTTAAAATDKSAKEGGPKAKKRKQGEDKAKKSSALDAAVRVLTEKGEAMTCGEMIQAMAAQGYWQSPAGKTPSATLYSALLREAKVKGKEARFHKVARGKFALRT